MWAWPWAWLLTGGLSRLCAAQVEMTGDTPTPPMDLTVTYPHLSPRGNNLLYLTQVAASPQVSMHTHTHTRMQMCNRPLFFPLQVTCWVKPKEINLDAVSSNPLKETLSDFLLVSSPPPRSPFFPWNPR